MSVIKIALVGAGNHVVKNLLPAYARAENVCVVNILVRDTQKANNIPEEYVHLLNDVEASLASDVTWVHISTPISTHFALTEKFLRMGKNVICEKPICEDIEKARFLFALAENLDLKLYEVSMYKFHKQFAYAKRIIAENKNDLVKVEAVFSIPHLASNDIRYNKTLAGGALLDVGYYPISSIINLLGKPSSMASNLYSAPNYSVDLRGISVFDYNDFFATAQWCIGAPYANEFIITTSTKKFVFPRFFSKPETFDTVVDLVNGFTMETMQIGKDDQFKNMIEAFINSNINQSEYKQSTLEVIEVLSALHDK